MPASAASLILPYIKDTLSNAYILRGPKYNGNICSIGCIRAMMAKTLAAGYRKGRCAGSLAANDTAEKLAGLITGEDMIAGTALMVFQL